VSGLDEARKRGRHNVTTPKCRAVLLLGQDAHKKLPVEGLNAFFGFVKFMSTSESAWWGEGSGRAFPFRP
jgi:hypothetical protein